MSGGVWWSPLDGLQTSEDLILRPRTVGVKEMGVHLLMSVVHHPVLAPKKPDGSPGFAVLLLRNLSQGTDLSSLSLLSCEKQSPRVVFRDG